MTHNYKNRVCYVYLLKNKEKKLCKIGITVSLSKRISSLRTNNARSSYELVDFIEFQSIGEARSVEAIIKDRFINYSLGYDNIKGIIDGYTEHYPIEILDKVRSELINNRSNNTKYLNLYLNPDYIDGSVLSDIIRDNYKKVTKLTGTQRISKKRLPRKYINLFKIIYIEAIRCKYYGFNKIAIPTLVLRISNIGSKVLLKSLPIKCNYGVYDVNEIISCYNESKYNESYIVNIPQQISKIRCEVNKDTDNYSNNFWVKVLSGEMYIKTINLRIIEENINALRNRHGNSITNRWCYSSRYDNT